MLFRKRTTILIAFFLFTLCPGFSSADEIASAGRSIFQKHCAAVVKVKLVIKLRIFISGNEVKNSELISETTGTILSPSGLTLVSLNTTEPGKLGGKNLDSEIGDIKIIFHDGKEVPATLVLRDSDLDLAFIMPLKKLTPPVHSIGSLKITEPEILDEFFSLGRLGKLGSREPSISFDRIHAIVKKPRTLYIPSFTRELGSPVFSNNGDWIGVILVRYNKTGRTTPRAMSVILPASDIMEVAGQALEIKTTEQ
ncbi:MAG: trypsin-like peptidase domain-containing protein [Deltaproteobacteria bacterium]|nr:trypsin-like peptidase domain-containing protein [Deltaproteobacteria bacterium]